MFGFFKKRPGADDVAKRLLILKHQVVYALAVPPAEAIEHLPAEERLQLSAMYRDVADRTSAALKEAKLWSLLTTSEREFFKTPGPELNPQLHLDALWRAEAAGCLMWCLDLLPALPDYDVQIDPEVMQSVGVDDVREFVRGAVLRDRQEIERARETAELWHWRSRTRQLQEQGYQPPTDAGFTLDQMIRMSTEHAIDAGDLSAAMDGDFPAFGKAYRDLDDEEWSVVRSITMERHFAFNWVCGHAPRHRWADTPTDT